MSALSMAMTTARRTNTGLTLYPLDDRRFWLNDIFNDRQGFITPEQAEVIGRHVVDERNYRPERLDDLLARYSGSTGRSVEELSRSYDVRGPLSASRGTYFTLPAHPKVGALA